MSVTVATRIAVISRMTSRAGRDIYPRGPSAGRATRRRSATGPGPGLSAPIRAENGLTVDETYTNNCSESEISIARRDEIVSLSSQ